MKIKCVLLFILMMLISPVIVYSFCSNCFGGVCANGCEEGEDNGWCDDCTNAYCGDNFCDPGKGEDYINCEVDCPPPCTSDCTTANAFDCPSGVLKQCQYKFRRF